MAAFSGYIRDLMNAPAESKSHPFWHYVAVNLSILLTVIVTAVSMWFRLGAAEVALHNLTDVVAKLNVDEYRLDQVERRVDRIETQINRTHEP